MPEPVPPGMEGFSHIVRKRPVNGPRELDPNDTLPATPEEVEEAETTLFERMMREPPHGAKIPGLPRGWTED